MALPDPYIRKSPNDLIRSGDWNDIQSLARQELRAHTHRGGDDGTQIPRQGIVPGAIDGSLIDPTATVTVATLNVTSSLKVMNRELAAEITSLMTRATALEGRATALESGKVNRAGDTISGALTIQGVLTPSVGNDEVHGILFPRDPGGGGGDRAFIRYFVESGETTKLLIGNNNDPDDRVSLYQMSGERLTIYNGCVGINNVTPGAALDVYAIGQTWGTWYEALRLSRPEHSAITHPGGKLMFGMHSNRNFYFGDTDAGRYVAVISTADAGRLGVGGEPSVPLDVMSPVSAWQVHFRNSNSNAHAYFCHGGGYGMHVRADTASTTNYLLELYNATQGGTKFFVTTAGNVGIGTNAPGASLHVMGDTLMRGGLTIGAGSNAALLTRHINGKTPGADNDDSLYLNWGNGKSVVINRPEQQAGLQVYGTGTFTGALTIGEWTLVPDGANLFIKRGGSTVAMISTNWDRLQIFQNLNGAPPYFYFNQNGAYGLYKP